ncbi:MAG TPA: 2-methylcitrate dehydratase [Nitrospinae bacterium]|nr:2-methylcitrate dehydratase [Nitrospinota bacterium]
MTIAEQLAAFAAGVTYDDLSDNVLKQVKLLVLDTIGCAIGSLGAEPVRYLRQQADDFGGEGRCTLIGGGMTAPDRATFYNTSLVRYLDFNDGYMGPMGTSHPSDNMAPVLAAAEYADASGRDFMAALALAYQVQCRFCDIVPSEKSGFDQGLAISYSVAAGASRALALDPAHTAQAIALSGACQNPLFVSRTGNISHWKGFATANAAFNSVHAAFLAMRGVTGPIQIFEGRRGLFESITGPFEIDWASEDLEKTLGISVKKFNAGVHSQTAIEGVTEMKGEHQIAPDQIESVAVETYERAYFIMGGGGAGDKHDVQNKETADHSLPYVIAAGLIDEQVMPAQYELDRILAEDVQALLRRVTISCEDDLTARYPAQSPVRITINMKDGAVFEKEKPGFEGFPASPMRWETLLGKFEELSGPHTSAGLRGEITDAVERLDSIQIRELTALLGRVEESA